MKLEQNQVEVRYDIMPGIEFYGIIDGLGTYKIQSTTLEIKTKSQIKRNFFQSLEYDQQVYGYPIGLKAQGKPYPVKCVYMIFHKVSKKIKKTKLEGHPTK